MFHVLHRASSHNLSVRRTRLLLLLMAGAAAVALSPLQAGAAQPRVVQADLNGDINNITAAYMADEVARAESENADALLVILDTPGGISTSMDDIVTSLLNSKVPTIVYVYPSGARAASAGLFVAQAADFLAMAPGTNIGSAHPIDASGADLTGDLGAKVLNDAVTRVRSLASMHGRNADWAEQAVRNSVNINAEDAVAMHVADIEAPDVPTLLRELDGRTVPLTANSVKLHTAGAAVEDSPMPFWMVFLTALIDPTVAALLLLLAAYGIITELSSPGAILPGVVGGIAAVLAVVSLANLPVNIAGALMLIVALGLFVADIKANTHGILSAGGIVAVVLGLAFLVNTGPIGLGVSPILIALAAVVSFAFFVLFVRRIWQARLRPVTTGSEALLGARGEAREEIAPEGMVYVRGALWRAVADGGPIHAGAPVRVTGRKGLQLQVAAQDNSAEEKKS
jgi:membrane-bound serine protease (ClpP class)